MSLSVPLTADFFEKSKKKFYECPKNRLAQNACSRVDPFEVAISRKAFECTQHVFKYRVKIKQKTNLHFYLRNIYSSIHMLYKYA